MKTEQTNTVTGTAEIDRIVARLKAEGWTEQRGGGVYLNRTIATNLLKDGEVLHIAQDFWPDDEIVEDLWPERKG